MPGSMESRMMAAVIELQAHVESRYAVVGKVNDKACGTQSFLQVLGELLLIFDNQ